MIIDRLPVQKRAGYDCRHDNKNCPACSAGHRADHGISGGEAWFAVATTHNGKRVALCLDVLTSFYPPTVPACIMPDGRDFTKDPPRGGTLSIHIEGGNPGDSTSAAACDWLGGKSCTAEVLGFIRAGQIYKMHGNQDPKADPANQSDELWLALERELAGWVEGQHANPAPEAAP